jgi:hypothetical protein
MKLDFEKFIIDLEMRKKKNAEHKKQFLESEETPQRKLLRRHRERVLDLFRKK